MTSLLKVSGVGPAMMAALAQKGISTAEDLAVASPEVLLEIPRVGPARVATLLAAAQAAIGAAGQPEPQDPVVGSDEANKMTKVATRKAMKAVKKTSAKGSKKADSKTSDTKKMSKKKPNDKTPKSEADAKNADQKVAKKKAAAKVKKKTSAEKTKDKKSKNKADSKGKKKKSSSKK